MGMLFKGIKVILVSKGFLNCNIIVECVMFGKKLMLELFWYICIYF